MSDVIEICSAYEAGYAKGQTHYPHENPYANQSKMHEAWLIGYLTAFNIELDRFQVGLTGEVI